uniref:Aspartate--tRNA ligase, cytoplasmic (Trinotate prediction) n=1 Tax=Henneguya salminicola TaxID=69463 RepID=A0A6G3MI79_HENSL
MIGRLLIYIFNQLKKRYQPLLEIVRDQYPSTDFMYTEEPLILKYQTGIEMLNEVGIEVGDLEDLSTPNEKLLGKLVRDKYQTDFYILDKYPLKVRPFYTMPDPYDYVFCLQNHLEF